MDLIKAFWPFTLGLVCGLVFITFNILGFDLSQVPGDLGDARFVMYLLEHFRLFFEGKVDSFWNAPFMFPSKEVLTFSENMLGVAPIFVILRWQSFDLETSFQLFYLICTALNYATCYYFINTLLKNKYAAAIGAFVFAFSLVLIGQVHHPQVYPRFFIPLTFLFAIKFIQSFNVRYLFLSCLFAVWQLFSIYI